MKTKRTILSSLVAGTLALTGSSASADSITSPADTTKILQQLSSVPPPELPAKAASLVVQAQGKDREKSAGTIVSSAVDLTPVSARLIVSSVSKLSPDVASVAAVAAASRQPKELGAIAKAAATAAPAQALKIVTALCKAYPEQYQTIALAVAEAVPKLDKSILAAVVDAVPTLKPFYVRSAQSLAEIGNGDVSVPVFLGQMARDIALSARTLKMSEESMVVSGITSSQQSFLPTPPAPTIPVQRPAFQPIGGTPTEIDRNQTTVIPPTGTRYSSP